MSNTKAFTFRLPEDLMAQVDEVRGDVNRTRFVLRALEAALGSDATPDPSPAAPREGERLPASPRASANLGALEGRAAGFRRATQ